MALLPDAGIETIEDKLETVLKLRPATVNDIPVLMHMALPPVGGVILAKRSMPPLLRSKTSPSTWRSPFACLCREQRHG